VAAVDTYPPHRRSARRAAQDP